MAEDLAASLVRAATEGSPGAVRSLLLRGADPAAAGPDGAPLSLAIDNGRDEVAHCLLDWLAETGADVGVHARDALGRTALYNAVHGEDLSLVERLLEAGADPNALCGKRWSALNAVSCSDGPEAFRLRAAEALIGRGADLDNRMENGGFTPLLQACFRGNHSVAALLVRSGADARAVSDTGYGVLAMAQTYPVELVRLLLRAGADPEHIGGDGWTPIQIAAFSGQADVVAEMLQHGADVNCGAPLRTPLSAAARNREGDAVRLLIDAGACTDAAANPPDTDWNFVAASALGWRREAEEALGSERAAHEATQESFLFALPHLLAAASRRAA